MCVAVSMAGRSPTSTVAAAHRFPDPDYPTRAHPPGSAPISSASARGCTIFGLETRDLFIGPVTVSLAFAVA